MIKKLSLLALVLLIIGIIGSIFTVNTQMKDAEMLEEVIETKDFNDIEIYTNNAKIHLVPTDNEEAKVELFGNRPKYELTEKVEGNTLHVNVKAKRNKLFSFDIFPKSLALTVYVPQKIYDTVQIKSNNGRIHVSDLESSEIQVKTNNGSTHLNNVQGEKVSLQTNNGRIEAGNVTAKFVKAEADNGRIDLEHIDGEIVGETNNGRISLLTDDLDRHVELQTDNGRINIQSKNKPTNAVLDLKTHNGKITVFGSSDWDTVIGNGDNVIKLTSHNGRITISD